MLACSERGWRCVRVALWIAAFPCTAAVDAAEAQQRLVLQRLTGPV